MNSHHSEIIKKALDTLDPIAIFDENGRYLYVNREWTNRVADKSQSPVGQYAWEVIPSSRVKEVLKTHKPLFGEIITVGGKKSFINYFPIFGDGKLVGVVMQTMFSGAELAVKAQSLVKELQSELALAHSTIQNLSKTSRALENMVGKSNAIEQLKQEILFAARTSSTVLIEGETGTGKELVAQAIHELSRKQTGRFVPVNCSAIPESLAESELFGYEEGSFTGAKRGGKPGKFELANHGTLFLDEIHQLSPVIQPKLLRALQERKIERVGGNSLIPVDIRFISATNTSLENRVAANEFRQDLFYRLNVVKIRIPPLRDRTEDIPLLSYEIVRQLNPTLRTDIATISDEALNYLLDYSWPGNIRELQNVIEAAMNRAQGSTLEKEHFSNALDSHHNNFVLSPMPVQSNNTESLKDKQQSIEYQMIKDALFACDGNKSKAAQKLGLARSVFYRKLKQYGFLPN